MMIEYRPAGASRAELRQQMTRRIRGNFTIYSVGATADPEALRDRLKAKDINTTWMHIWPVERPEDAILTVEYFRKQGCRRSAYSSPVEPTHIYIY